MKKIFFLSLIAFLSLASCEDESLNPLPEKITGQYMKLDVVNRQLIIDAADPSFGGLLTDTSGKVVKYELFVRRTDYLGFTLNDYALCKTITAFPHELKVTIPELALALNVNESDLKIGDSFRFLGYSYDASGNKSGFLQLATIIQSTATMEQGYKFNTSITNAATFDPTYNNRNAD